MKLFFWVSSLTVPRSLACPHFSTAALRSPGRRLSFPTACWGGGLGRWVMAEIPHGSPCAGTRARQGCRGQGKLGRCQGQGEAGCGQGQGKGEGQDQERRRQKAEAKCHKASADFEQGAVSLCCWRGGCAGFAGAGAPPRWTRSSPLRRGQGAACLTGHGGKRAARFGRSIQGTGPVHPL